MPLTIDAAFVIAVLAALGLALRGQAHAITECRGYPQSTPEYGFQGGVIINTNLPERMCLLVLLDPRRRVLRTGEMSTDHRCQLSAELHFLALLVKWKQSMLLIRDLPRAKS